MNFGGRLFFLYEMKEASLTNSFARLCFSWLARLNVWRNTLKLNLYGVLSTALRIERDFSSIHPATVPTWVHRVKREILPGDRRCWHQLLLSYRKTTLAHTHQKKYCGFDMPDRLRIRQPKNPPPPERQGDLLVLKPSRPREKGVLFLNFDETVDKFFALYDAERLAKNYRIVFEPSAWGYQQVRMFFLQGLNTDVIIEAQYRQDFEYIETLGGALKPKRLGAGDWTDPDLFQSGKSTEKKYDLVMIANWLKWKRHKLLFQAMKSLQGKLGRVALIGYPIEGRTSDEILSLAIRFGIEKQIDIFENISAIKVGQIIRSAKAGILLSKKEGANRGIYECLFSDVPVLLASCNIGVNRDHINAMTGMLSSDAELAEAIIAMVERYESFQPRNWALENTGAAKSSARLNVFLKKLAVASGEVWTQDIFPKKNAPAPLYLREEHRLAADREVEKLASYLLP
ncbi:MAG: glycoside hydrolase family protein [uncultured bacterium]|nr:MAG: glycoside hydrolase family protein [uncultured bacterium]